jgi:hypothetical protein
MPENADGEQKLIDAIYRGACDPAELKRAIELIAQHFDSSGVVLAELDQGAPNAPLTIGARSMDQAFFANYAPFASLDPAPRAFAALKVGTVSTTDRIFSEDFLRTSIFLNEFLRRTGLMQPSADRCFRPAAGLRWWEFIRRRAANVSEMRTLRAWSGSRRI